MKYVSENAVILRNPFSKNNTFYEIHFVKQQYITRQNTDIFRPEFGLFA
jgi:hypothetical protein